MSSRVAFAGSVAPVGSTHRFVRCERGAMTIDWVALSASMLALAIAIVYAIYISGVGNSARLINTTLDNSGAVADHTPTPGPDTFR